MGDEEPQEHDRPDQGRGHGYQNGHHDHHAPADPTVIDSECGGDIGPESHDIERPQVPDRQNRHSGGQDQREHQQIRVDRAEGGEEPVLKDEELVGIQEPLDEGGP